MPDSEESGDDDEEVMDLPIQKKVIKGTRYL